MREGIQLYNQKKYKEALNAFLKAEVSSEDYAIFGYFLGLCYVRTGQYDEALMYLDQAGANSLGFAYRYQCRMLVGYIYAETKQLRLAAEEFQKLLEDGFESAKVYSALAHVLLLEQNLQESVKQLEQALKLEPNNPNALNSMGFVLAESNSRLETALSYCQKALSLKPETPAYLDSLGWVYFKMGRHTEAVTTLRKAAIMAPEASTIKNHLQKVVNYAN